jgi:hypothetical protein
MGESRKRVSGFSYMGVRELDAMNLARLDSSLRWNDDLSGISPAFTDNVIPECFCRESGWLN